MRTTVTLDPDVEKLLRRAVRERGEPFKRVLNDALRDGLREKPVERASPFQQITYDMGIPRVDLTKANALTDELGDEAFIAKWRARQR